MTANDQSTSDRREQTRHLIDNLLAERKQLLGLLFDDTSPGLDDETTGSERRKEFCQILVDYIAAGHFGLYQRISEGTERRKSVLAVAEQAYPRIESITQLAVAFSDKCEANDYQSTDSLRDELSNLVESLSTRFELEDQIIEGILRT